VIVVGLLAAEGTASGTVVEIARRAAGGGVGPLRAAAPGPSRRVEVLGMIPGDASWDRATIELAHAGVGHATVVRSARGSMEPADLELALRYLPEIRVIVLVQPPDALVATAISAASWSGAALVLIGPLEGEIPATDPAPIVLDPPDADPDGTFAGFVARLAAEIDDGQAPAEAWQRTVGQLAADKVG
jgi:hypothetical protein